MHGLKQADRKGVYQNMERTPNIKDAVYLIDDDCLFGWGALPKSSWDYINDSAGNGGARGDKGYWLIISDKDGETYLRRDCTKFEGGLLTFEILMENISGEGFYISFGSRDNYFLKLITKGEELYVGNAKIGGFSYGLHFIKLYMDLASSKVTISLDARICGEFDFDKKAFAYNCLKIGYGEEDKGCAGIYFTKLYVNYLVNDACLNRYTGKLPDEYKVTAQKGAKVVSDYRVGKNKPSEFAYISSNRKETTTITKRAFEKAKGNVVFEVMYLQSEAKGKVKISLCKGTNDVVSVYDEGEELYSYDGYGLRKHHLNVWQTLRIYADTDKSSATIWLNGKKTKTVAFENTANYIDNFKIVYEAYEDSSLMFSDILLWIKPDEPRDYVPAPVVPKKKNGHIVGMNICSLWREGTHSGWDCISPFDDIKPVLGYYDEGLPETADWEIKFMVEHGIDYALYCWYSSEQKAPIKTTRFHHALVDGHFYAKYGDMEKFAVLWEAANCAHPTCVEEFKGNIVPYWLDYFFSDPRYMRLDNKAVISCFGVSNALNDLGGAECMKEAIEYLRNEVKKLGYDDLIVMGCHEDPNRLKELGFDAFHAYHWGGDGYKLHNNIGNNEQRIAMNKVHIVPTISVGFNNVGWGGFRRPNLSAQDMYNGLTYCIDKILPKYEKGTWKEKTLHLSTWNEYGEGTYIMPSGLNGFGYLDAVRKAVCVDEEHEDIIPTESQKARIGYLHLPDRHLLSKTKYDVRPLPEKEKIVKMITFKTEADIKKWKFTNMTDIRIEDGVLCGKATSDKAVMELKKLKLDACDVAYMKVVCSNTYGTSDNSAVFRTRISNSPKKDNFCNTTRSVWLYRPELTEFTFQLDIQPFFSDTIYGLQIEPTPVKDGTFRIKSVIFYASLPHISVYSPSGRQLFYTDYPEEKNGEIYLPLDPYSGIIEALNVKYEWFKDEGRLEFWNKTEKVTLVTGKPYAVKNGESYTLVRPVYLKDGIPAISLTDIKKLFEIDIERNGNKIYLKPALNYKKGE